jgi:ribosomal protein S3AE
MALKKKFFDIEIPLLNQKTEAYVYSIENLDKRALKIDLTRMLRGKSIELLAKIEVKDGKAVADARKLTLLGFFIRRMLRKGVDYVEDSFSVECKDAKLRVKPFLITRKKVSRKVKNALRISAKDFLFNYIKERGKEEVFRDMISSQIQRALSLRLKKIYPLALCEIRVLNIE